VTDFYAEMQSYDSPNWQKFKIDLILEDMPEDEAKSLRAALDDTDIAHITVARVLSSHGHIVSAGAVRNWRHGQSR